MVVREDSMGKDIHRSAGLTCVTVPLCQFRGHTTIFRAQPYERGRAPPFQVREASSDAITTAATLASVVLVVAILYFAQEVLLPIALAVLRAFILSPLTIWLERWHFGRIPSVLAAVTLDAARELWKKENGVTSC